MKSTAIGFCGTCVVVASIVTGCDRGSTGGDQPAAKAPPAQVTATHPARGAISRWISLPAEVQPLQQATLYAKTAGYLKTISVDKGDTVKSNALLAEIESPELLADIAKYKTETHVAEVNLKRLSEAREKAPDLVVPLTIDEARGKLEVARAGAERVETLLSYTKIYAPFTGIITRRFVDPGALVPAATSGGAAQSAAIVTIMDFSTVRIQAAVPEMEVPYIKPGLPVTLTADELAKKAFSGSVTRISYALDPSTKTMLTEIELPNANGELRPGMFVTARIAVETKGDALLIPAEALVTEKAKTSVFKLADGAAHKVPVKAGFNDGKSVEIVDGVAPGDTLIVAGKTQLADGQPVQVTEGK